MVISNLPNAGITKESTLTRLASVNLPQPSATPEEWEALRCAVDQCAPRLLPFYLQLSSSMDIAAEINPLAKEFIAALGPQYSRTALNVGGTTAGTNRVVCKALGEQEAAAFKSWAVLHWSKAVRLSLSPASGTAALFRCACLYVWVASRSVIVSSIMSVHLIATDMAASSATTAM